MIPPPLPPTPAPYDLIIVGRGLVGSAAARHAASNLDDNLGRRRRIALVGPSEPTDKSSDPDRDIFGAHYDEGRITRRTDSDPVWAELASRSVSRYGEILGQSGGLEFYTACGHLAVGPVGSDTIEKRRKTASSMGVEYKMLDASGLEKEFSYLNFPSDCVGLFEGEDAGYVSARNLVAAQTKAAEQKGVETIDAVVSEIARETHQSNDGGSCHTFTVRIENRHETLDSRTLLADRVLVAAGAFCSARKVLPAELDLTPIKTQTVHFILPDNPKTNQLSTMPSIIFKDKSMWAYLLPPICYPDGSMRLKLGGAHLGPDGNEYGPVREMKSNEEVAKWYRSLGEGAALEEMTGMLRSIVPGAEPLQIISDSCATLNTPTRQAYIGELEPGWAVATGGNGFAAKSSDELGRLAAMCVFDRESFEKERICGRFVSDVMRPILKEKSPSEE